MTTKTGNILKPGGTPANASSGFAFESDSRLLSHTGITRMPSSQREWQNFILELNKWVKSKSGIFVPTFTGFSSDPANPTVEWYLFGKYVSLYFNFATGTSDATGFTITNLPDEINPGRDVLVPAPTMMDGGTLIGGDGVALVQGANKQIRFLVDHNLNPATSWATSLAKGFEFVGQIIIYPILAPEQL